MDVTLQRMGEAVGQLVDPPTVARRLLQASTELLGVKRGVVYLRQRDPAEYARRSGASMARHVQAMLEFQQRGAIVFDYGNNLRQRAFEAGVPAAFTYPGFVPAFIRPLFCEGKGPFRGVALSGDEQD